MIEMASGVVVDSRYRLLSRLGSGGMAEVWAAEDTELGRQVALKLLHSRLAADQDFVERFRREASAAAGLQHPNVVSVYDRGESQGTYYIAMEYLRGSSLKDLVRRGPLEPRYAVELVVQVLKAARFAHRNGIIHRDLKPHNVMLDDEGRVKVTDFGIARAGASDMTETGSVMGTAQYLSPEQAQGHAVTASSDLYSIGVMLFELLTGRVPFEGESPVTIALRHVSEAPPAPSQLNPAVPPALDAVVLRALAKEPRERFADADEFVAALTAAVTAPQDVTQITRIAPAAAYVPAREPVGPYAEPEPEPERSRSWPWWLAAALVLAALGLGAYLLLGADRTPVPDVVGREAAVAVRELERAGLQVEQRNVASEDVRRGRVADQDPGAGQEVAEDSVVIISISTGPPQVAVPDVVGISRQEAQTALRAAGFRVRVQRRYSDAVAEDEVIATDPAAGTDATKGSRVTLTVSRGVEPVAVPDVTGLDRDGARQALEELGLRPVFSSRETDDEEAGQVLEQEPAAGSAVEEGAEVQVVVAEAPPEVDVPDVVELREDEARSQLENADLKVRRRRVDTNLLEEDGVVLEQDPAAGGTLPPGSRVTIVVGRFVAEPPAEGGEPAPEDELDPTDPTR
ncbi:MAG: Serine/threonine protein kinase PrkC, regulator of stationary phase [uncultured Solirubrobacteraceae bacterium]|uniref:non-specific serine/threonine protein kinase n=1 Tax=uncultured Solirubrobacteraceae bacterium TaxID=1162706 RepID=A0A6J4RIX1_9ACTN|nr:MAG: Serine/threonine protein kinase PrkC, regulator of stationary phase [uncultured Solirubrobacteraceae bacterium]